MAMGRRARPIELHVLKGNHRTKAEIAARRQAEEAIRPPADDLKPPKWLSAAAKREWRRIVKVMEGLGLLTNADVDTLAAYCDAVARCAEAAKILNAEGMVVEGSRGPQQHPMVLVYEKYERIRARCASQLGLDPSSRAALAHK